jgi:hypothetical protein
MGSIAQQESQLFQQFLPRHAEQRPDSRIL